MSIKQEIEVSGGKTIEIHENSIVFKDDEIEEMFEFDWKELWEIAMEQPES